MPLDKLLNLSDDEQILFACPQRIHSIILESSILLLIIPISIMTIVLRISSDILLLNIILIIVGITFSLIFIGFGVYMLNPISQLARTMIFITNKRIIELTGEAFFKKSRPKFPPVLEELKFDRIDFIKFWNRNLSIARKYSDGKRFYKGDEKEYKYDETDVDFYNLEIGGPNASFLKEYIYNLLIKEIPCFKHPNLDTIYIANP